MSNAAFPETLIEAVTYFSDEDRALSAFVALRWASGVRCPHCDAVDVTFMESRRVWQCKAKECRKQFSAKVGTIFEDSPLPLSKWMPAVWMIANCKNGISSYELHRALGITQKSAWFMLHRIRLAMQDQSFGKLGGSVEVDETFIGGKARNMHFHKRQRVIKGTGSIGKTAVMGLLERHPRKGSRVRAEVIAGLEEEFIHGVVDHGERYVDRHHPHQRPRKLLVPPEAHHQGHLRCRRAVPSSPLPRPRAGVPFQSAQGRRPGPLHGGCFAHRWEARHLPLPHWQEPPGG